MSKIVLWIDDQATISGSKFFGPIAMTGKIQLVPVLNASEALNLILTKQYDAIIVDVRIPPGDHQGFHEYHIKKGCANQESRLGIQLLYMVFNPTDNPLDIEPNMQLEHYPDWLKPEMVGLFTCETDNILKSDIEKLRIKHYRFKSATSGKTLLLELIEEILKNNKKTEIPR
jgi:hypothetical protein